MTLGVMAVRFHNLGNCLSCIHQSLTWRLFHCVCRLSLEKEFVKTVSMTREHTLYLTIIIIVEEYKPTDRTGRHLPTCIIVFGGKGIKTTFLARDDKLSV